MALDGEIEECVRAEYQRLVGAVTLVTGSSQLAENAVEEAFRAVERSRRGYHSDHLAGWVATVVRVTRPVRAVCAGAASRRRR
jgi:DNA-directed RNA polymerase specialized sigma24 family protein